MSKTNNFFTEKLLQWHSTINREMPWKGEKNAYLVWLSEIILQQTRVDQGLPYFLKFKTKYPTIIDLANAPEDEIMKLWQGLGYYSRARNLHATAKIIRDKYQGIFPNKYEEILQLKGVGSYTAAAITSFAFEQYYAVVDGNVYRVLSRFFGIETPVDSTKAKKQFNEMAHDLIVLAASPSTYNQAIMDFGALHCKPALPNCESCAHQKKCVAFKTDKVALLPIKEKKIKVNERFFHYLVIQQNKNIFLHKRINNDIWKNLYEFPLIEASKLLTLNELKKHDYWKMLFKNELPEVHSKPIITTQKLTHQKINAIFVEITINNVYFKRERILKIPFKKIHNFAFPKIIDWYFQNK
jgi:A/G-specific adenine glycosylase